MATRTDAAVGMVERGKAKVKIQFSYEGNGKKNLAGAVALVIIFAGVMWWQSGADKRNDDRNLEQSLAQARQAQQAHDQAVREEVFSPGSRYIYPHEQVIYDILRAKAKPLIEKARQFQDPEYRSMLDVFCNQAQESLLTLENSARREMRNLIGNRDLSDQQKMEIGEKLGRKYATLFREWFAPKWVEVQDAGPGKASWHLKYAPVE